MVKTKSYAVLVLENYSSFSYCTVANSPAAAVKLYYAMVSMAIRKSYYDGDDFQKIMNLQTDMETFRRKFNSFEISVTLEIKNVVQEVGKNG